MLLIVSRRLQTSPVAANKIAGAYRFCTTFIINFTSMRWSLRTKLYCALLLSLMIVPIFYFALPVSHDDWWMGFRVMNHAVRAFAPLLTIIGYYALFAKRKRYAYYLILVSLICNTYLLNLDFYNLCVIVKSPSFSRFYRFMFEGIYIGLFGLLVFIFTILFNVEIIVRNNSEANQVI